MIFQTSWDDGFVEDLRLADLLRRFELPATFFIPSNTQLNKVEIKKLADGFEIGGHTVSHPQDLKMLNDVKLKSEIEDNKIWLEEIIGRPIYFFCYPRGRYDDRVIGAVRSAGYFYGRTTLVNQVEVPPDHFRWHTTIHAFQREEYVGRPWDEVAREKFTEARELGEMGYFHLWGHGWEIGKNHDWEKLENLLEFVSENKP